MDYRHRKYYLVSIPYFSRDMRIGYFKIAAPSLKMHTPYNHVHIKEDFEAYDGIWHEHTGVRRPDAMLSCRIEDSNALEYELRKMVRNDYPYGKFFELTKNYCLQ